MLIITRRPGEKIKSLTLSETASIVRSTSKKFIAALADV